jgi:hypothetical protein
VVLRPKPSAPADKSGPNDAQSLRDAVSLGTILVRSHPEQPGRLASRLLADDDPDIKPRHFGDVMSTGKLFSLKGQLSESDYGNGKLT